MKKVCKNCKYLFRWEDDMDEGYLETLRGRRVGYRCNNSNSPVIATVVERESNPSMKEEDCFIHSFGCTLWEKK